MTDPSLLSDLRDGKQRFLSLVTEVRAELHRYAARMMGSVVEGEDIVQETLAAAYFQLSESEAMPDLRPWLFRIAHNRAIDALRRYERRHGTALEDAGDVPDGAPDPEDALARAEAVKLALSQFGALPPIPRAAVVLKDVLGHSMEEIVTTLGLSLPAVKAALHRGRGALRTPGEAPHAPEANAVPELMTRYAALFNARDWDAVRSLLAEDVRLDLVSRARRRGRKEVGAYVSNYASVSDWHLIPARLEGRPVLAVFRSSERLQPDYFVEVSFANGLVEFIRDFRYVPYIATDAVFELV